MDGSTGRPIASAGVEVIGTPARVLTDLEGRYRTTPVPAGVHSVQVTMLSYATARIDSVRVTAGEVTTLRLVMEPQAIQLEAVVATVTGHRAASAAGLLAVQKNAPAVMDGISAEQMSRTPDSDAADAIARVTGVSIVDRKFVVTRGLTERYSSTLLNGVELASPEPTRRIVPLDIFPAALLESIVVTKTATPDLPGDFAGGSVNIQTKDFPEERVLDFKVSQGYNSQVTFKNLPVLSRHGWRDMTGFDNANRTHKRSDFPSANALAEAVRPVWSAAPRQLTPDLGFSLQYGDQLGEFQRALGYVLSFDYGYKTSYEPSEYFAVTGGGGTPVIETSTEHATTTANWGAVGNVTLRLGTSHTIGIKNMVTQESEEFAVLGQSAFNANREGGLGAILHRYQVRYVERGFLQTQLRGQHRLTWPFRTQWNWNATLSRARRDEPENRTLTYGDVGDVGYRLTRAQNNFFWFRYLDDRIKGANADLSIPLGWWPGEAEALLKVGAGDRRKDRQFDASRFNLIPPSGAAPPDGYEALALPPNLVTAPENIGRNLLADPTASGGLPYSANDEVRSAFVMADLPLPFGLRAVGGMRAEEWALDVRNPNPLQGDSIILRNQRDYLWSMNLTMALSDRMNLRAAGYRTISRPDPRELVSGPYVPVAGQCEQRGNPDLNRADILNSDLRWEWYPAPGELVSLTGFYKLFTQAIIEVVALQNSECITRPDNARTAYVAGGELEFRKGLGFLAGALENVALGVNVTYTDGTADLILGNSRFKLPLQDQSKYIANGSLFYTRPNGGFTATVLYNYFADRVTLYGDIAFATAGAVRTPDIIEKSRGTVDFKVTKRLRGITAAFSGKNLTNEIVQQLQLTQDGGSALVGRSHPGTSFSLSLGYVF